MEELQRVASWHLSRGLNDLQLGDFAATTQNLLQSLYITWSRPSAMEELQFLALVSISAIKLDHPPAPWPTAAPWKAWDSQLRALVIAYMPDHRALYVRNGSLFQMVLRLIGVRGPSEVEKLEYLKGFDKEAVDQSWEEILGQLAEGNERGKDAVKFIMAENATLAASEDILGTKGIEEMQRMLNEEIDTACLIVGKAMGKKETLDLNWYEDMTYYDKVSAIINSEDGDSDMAEIEEGIGAERTAEVDAILEEAEKKVFLKGPG